MVMSCLPNNCLDTEEVSPSISWHGGGQITQNFCFCRCEALKISKDGSSTVSNVISGQEDML